MPKKNINTASRRVLLPVLIGLFAIIIISMILFIWYIFSGNYIIYSMQDDSYKSSTLSDANNANIILMNNIVLGGTTGSKWIDANTMYEAYNTKNNIEVDVYNTSGMYGTYKTASFRRYDNSVVYTTLNREAVPNNYIALTKFEGKRVLPGMTKVEPTEDDESYVKSALGAYKLINGSIKITEVYTTNISETTDKIICVVSKKPNILGVYSAVIYVTGNKASIVKYAYVKDTNNSSRWPVYSLKFVMDLNNVGAPELVLEETTGTDVIYSILELKENNFYEVLKTTIAL